MCGSTGNWIQLALLVVPATAEAGFQVPPLDFQKDSRSRFCGSGSKERKSRADFLCPPERNQRLVSATDQDSLAATQRALATRLAAAGPSGGAESGLHAGRFQEGPPYDRY